MWYVPCLLPRELVTADGLAPSGPEARFTDGLWDQNWNLVNILWFSMWWFNQVSIYTCVKLRPDWIIFHVTKLTIIHIFMRFD